MVSEGEEGLYSLVFIRCRPPASLVSFRMDARFYNPGGYVYVRVLCCVPPAVWGESVCGGGGVGGRVGVGEKRESERV